MSDIDEPEWDKTDYFGSDLTKKRLLELKEALDHYDEIRGMLPPFFDVWYRFQGEDKEDLHILVQEED